MTSTSVLRVANSGIHPWESGDRRLASLADPHLRTSSKGRVHGLVVGEAREMDTAHGTNPPQRNKPRQNSAQGASTSPPKPIMALKQSREPNMVLKRSFSTPAVRSLGQDAAQDSAQQSAEKKRNKLGYHRTSIACTHCRRRKIRCIVSTDVQNRCVNCIRLKKDCSFYPVDQQPTPDGKNKAPSQGTSNSGIASQSSSPALAPSQMAEMPSTAAFVPQPQPLSMATAGQSIPSTTTTHTIPTGRGPIFPADQQFLVPSQPGMPWGSGEPSPVAMPSSAGLGMGWGSFSSEPSTGDQYTAYTHGPGGPVPQWLHSETEPGSQPEWAWTGVPPTTRSMSFSGDLMTQPSQHPMVPMTAQGQPYQGMGDMSNLFAAPMQSPPVPEQIQGDVSSMGSVPWQHGQQGQQQMVLQHRQQNIYRQPSTDFEGWDFPNPGGGQRM